MKFQKHDLICEPRMNTIGKATARATATADCRKAEEWVQKTWKKPTKEGAENQEN